MVPNGWKRTVLKEILEGEIKNGFSPNASENETGYWVLGLGALRDNGLIKSEIKPVKPSPKTLNSLLISDDFLISRSNTPDKVGRSARFRGEIKNCSYPDLMMRFRVNTNEVSADYIEANLKSATIRSYFRNCAAGSSATMVKINKTVVENTPLLLPPLPEQKKIAQILSTWDKAITITEKLLANSQQQKKALMQQLLTGKKRFQRFEEKWEKVAQGKYAKFYNGRAYKLSEWEEQGIPVIRLQNLTGRGEEFYYSNLELPLHQYCEKGDLLYMWSATFGPHVWKGPKAIYHYHIWKVECTEGFLDKHFMYYLLDYETQRWMSQSNGMGLLHITKGTMEKLQILLPPFKEQQKIASALSIADQEIKTIQQKLDYLKQEKKALMQQLLTGKRRVKVDKKEVA